MTCWREGVARLLKHVIVIPSISLIYQILPRWRPRDVKWSDESRAPQKHSSPPWHTLTTISPDGEQSVEGGARVGLFPWKGVFAQRPVPSSNVKNNKGKLTHWQKIKIWLTITFALPQDKEQISGNWPPREERNNLLNSSYICTAGRRSSKEAATGTLWDNRETILTNAFIIALLSPSWPRNQGRTPVNASGGMRIY